MRWHDASAVLPPPHGWKGGGATRAAGQAAGAAVGGLEAVPIDRQRNPGDPAIPPDGHSR